MRGNIFKSQQEPIMLENLGDQHTLGFPVLLRYALTKKCTYSKTRQKSLASFASDWLRGWLKSSGPMTLQTKAEIKKSKITFTVWSKIALKPPFWQERW